MNKYVVVALTATALTACGVAGKIGARHDYEDSVAAYSACLREHPPQQCEGARLSMQAQERLYTCSRSQSSEVVLANSAVSCSD